MRPGTRRGQPGRPPRRRGAISIGTGIFLIAAGAILLFAVTAGTSPLNWHIVGVILILTGVAGLLLPPVVQVWPTPGPPRTSCRRTNCPRTTCRWTSRRWMS